MAGQRAEPFHLVFLRDDTLVKVARNDQTAGLVVRYLPNQGGVQLREAEVPRSFLSGGWSRVDSFEEAAVRLRDGHDFVEKPLVETGRVNPPFPESERSAHPLEISEFTRNTVVVKSSEQHEGLLVLGEAWFPGWRAMADELERPVFLVNSWQRGVFIESGVQTVRFRYRPRWLWPGAAVSSLAIILCVGLWVVSRGEVPPTGKGSSTG